MLTSASATPQAALAKLLAGFRPECSSPGTSADPALSPLWRSSRYIFHATQSRRIPPASMSPTIWSSWDTIRAKAMRSTSAAATPIMITFLRCSAGRPAASAPTTIALSPARTMSIRMIWTNAASAPDGMTERSMGSALAERQHVPQAQHMFAAYPALVDHTAGHPQDDGQPDIVEPGIALDQLCYVIVREAHEEHREAEADNEQGRIVARDRGDQQHV